MSPSCSSWFKSRCGYGASAVSNRWMEKPCRDWATDDGADTHFIPFIHHGTATSFLSFVSWWVLKQLKVRSQYYCIWFWRVIFCCENLSNAEIMLPCQVCGPGRSCCFGCLMVPSPASLAELNNRSCLLLERPLPLLREAELPWSGNEMQHYCLSWFYQKSHHLFFCCYLRSWSNTIMWKAVPFMGLKTAVQIKKAMNKHLLFFKAGS